MKKGYWTIGSTLIVMTAAVALYAWPDNAAESNTDLRRTATVSLGTLNETVVATGVIRPVTGAEVNVGSRISGTVVSLPVAVGDQVEIGQLLAELDATALEAQADEARADVALSSSQIRLAESILARRQRLAEDGLVSVEDLETAENDLAVARAQLQADQARLRSAEIALSYTRVTAPINGVVAEVSTREGETVAAAFAAPNFVTIIDLDGEMAWTRRQPAGGWEPVRLEIYTDLEEKAGEVGGFLQVTSEAGSEESGHRRVVRVATGHEGFHLGIVQFLPAGEGTMEGTLTFYISDPTNSTPAAT